MLWTPGNRFEAGEMNDTSIASAHGTSFTPANNTKVGAAWAEAFASTARETYGIGISFNSVFFSTSARDCIADIGIGAAAAETVLIPDLLCSCAPPFSNGAIEYYFPLYIPAATRISVRASVNEATVRTGRCYIRLYQKPSRPDMIRWGTFVRSFGITAATSAGTAITPGLSAAEGAWTQLGSATAEDLWWWQVGYGVNDATMTAMNAVMDLAHGDATTKRVIMEDVAFGFASNEVIVKSFFGAADLAQAYCEVPTGQLMYGRASISGATADSANSMACWGLG